MFQKIFMIPEEIDKTTADYTTYKVIFYFSALLLFLLPYMIVVDFYNKNFYQSMIIEFIGFFAFFFLHVSLYKNHNLQKTSLYFIAILITMLVSGNLSCSVNEYGLVWNYFIPLASFYLLGSKQGVKVTLVFSIYLFVYSIYLMPEQLSHMAANNFLLSYSVITLCTYVYEKTREYSHQQIKDLLESEHQHTITLEKVSMTDPLTQIYNRLKLDDFLQLTYSRAQRYNENFTIMIVDIDHFKEVNDTYGHLVGDKVLKDFSKILSTNLRKSDIVGRWGGEEFMIILPNTQCKASYDIAENLRQTIESYDFGYKFSNTASFGIASYDKEESVLELVNNADNALYHSKEKGRNGISTKLSLGIS